MKSPFSNNEMGVKLKPDGTNFLLWRDEVFASCEVKGYWCGIALSESMPRTRADGAVRHILRSSIPEGLALETRKLRSAHEVFTYIQALFTGGSNWEQNQLWREDLD